MSCLGCHDEIYQPYQGPLWIDGKGAEACPEGGQHEPDDGNSK